MPYELRDFNNNVIEFYELNEKSFACKHGESQEELFVHTFQRLKNEGVLNTSCSVEIHPEKEVNPYHPDLAVNGLQLGELKSKASPLFIANKYGISPQFALTMDLKDSFHYSKFLDRGIDISIYIWVKWAAQSMSMYRKENDEKRYTKYYEPVKQFAGIWKVQFSELRRFEQLNHPPIHWYNEKFRQPPEYDFNCLNDEDKRWVDELIKFEPRLSMNGIVKSIASRGYTVSNGELYSSGDSSGSYVFDLNNSIFECLYSNGIYKK
ncbi:hypothetical protein [Vibrio cyclitrophicus]|uniref:hypothetical protein n=1 Tax=Vibrio cyclitrophicus TaxID=47951 RepID=UPI0011B3B7B0|nr:hypothetical protein [Vibrio cyclitrophicus]